MEKRRVHFFSDGLRLNAMMFLPEGEGPFPGVVFCQGLASTWDKNSQPFLSESLADAGIASLLFDHRGLGGSEGERGYIFPCFQVADIRSAITFFAAEQPIDEGLIGLSGASFGGANSIVVSAIDKRVRAVLAACAFANGRTWMREIRRYWEWQSFLERLQAHREHKVLSGRSELVALDEILIRDPEGERYAREMMEKFGPREPVPLDLAEKIIEYRPEDLVGRISPRPLLLIHGNKDAMIPVDEAKRLAARAGEPKRLTILDGAGHYNLYSSFLQEYSSLMVEFFHRHLVRTSTGQTQP